MPVREAYMKSKPKILYRPLPTKKETVKGYLMRVAYENGYDFLNLLSKAIGHSIGPALYLNDLPEHNKVNKILRHHLCLTPEEFGLCDIKDHSLIQSNRSVINITDSKIKLCIECLKETPMLLKKWEAIHTTHCIKHRCELVHTCPSCDKPFTENTKLFDCCSRCELKWADINMVKSCPPVFQQIDEGLTGDKQVAFRAALYQMLVFVTRPLDLQLAEYQQLPKFMLEADMTQYFNYAFAMLTNEPFTKSMLNRRKEIVRAQGNIRLLLPRLSYFDEKIHQSIKSVEMLELQNTDEDLKLPDGLDNASLHKNSEDSHPKDYPFKIKHNAVADLLGVSAIELNQLAGEEVIKGFEFISMKKRNWFDIRTVEGSLQSIDPYVEYSDISHKQWINLYGMSSSLHRNNLSFAKALKLVISNGLTLITNKHNWQLSDLKVCRNDAVKLFEAHFIESLSGPIQKRDILNYFQFNGKQFEAFKSLFKDELIFGKCDFGYIPGEAIKRLFDNYILLNKQCQLKKVNLKKCVNELKATGLLPDNSEVAQSNLFLYKKSSHIQAAINAITLRLARK